MLALHWILVAACCSGAIAARFDAANATRSQELAPYGYIVELDQGASIRSLANKKRAKRDIPSDHEAVYSHLRKRGVAYQVSREFTSSPKLFYGATIKLNNLADLEHLQGTPGIKNVWVNEPLFIPSISSRDGGSDAKLPKGAAFLTLLRAMARNILPQKQGKLSGYGPLAMTGLDRAHSFGFRGKGINIAVIDTGIDYTHPDLGGCFGPGCRVAKGYDFVGNQYTATGVATPSDNPLSQCFGGSHGTHVAGIAAGGTNLDIGIAGAAPEATIFAYKIFDCTTTTTTDLVMDAVVRAVGDGADIINISITFQGSWSSSPLASFISRAVQVKNVFITISSGDNGLGGLFFATSPAVALGALSVGMVSSTKTNQFTITTSTGYGPIRYFGSHSFGFADLPVYATSSTIAPDADACSALPDSTPDLSNVVVVVARGGCPVFQKLQNIAAKGAQRALVYDYEGSTTPAYDDGLEVNFPNGNAGVISYADGAYLVQQFNSKASFTLSGTSRRLWQSNNPGAGLIDPESQFGPSWELNSAVSLVAPGVNILSTYPVPLGSYSILTGTSQSAPYVAGALAVYLQAKQLSPPYDVPSIVNSFIWAAKPTNNSYAGISGFDPIPTQGGGLLDAFTPIVSSAGSVSPSFLNLNDTRYPAQVQQLTVVNSGSSVLRYTITHVPAPTVYSLDANSIYPSNWPGEATPAPATVSINGASGASSVSLRPRGSSKISIRFTPPAGIDNSRFPLYSGFIRLANDDGTEVFTVPYQGVAAAMYDLPVLDTGSAVAGAQLPLISDSNFNIQTGPATYNYTGASVPNLALRLVGGTSHLTVYVLPGNSTGPPAPSGSKPYLAFPDGVANLGLVPGLDATYVGRNVDDASKCVQAGCIVTQVIPWQGNVQSADGTVTTLPNGSYRLMLSATKLTGDDTNFYDHEVYVSPVITIQR